MDGRIRYQLYSIVFPEGQDAEQWKKIFKPCATQRLFLPVSRDFEVRNLYSNVCVVAIAAAVAAVAVTAAVVVIAVLL